MKKQVEKFYVYSRDWQEVLRLEVTRTDRSVALEDARLIKEICHKTAWVETSLI